MRKIAPVIESIEDRTLFSTFIVTTTSDSGAGSLRDALTKANKTTAADVIQFEIGSGLKTLSPKTPLPYQMYPVTIDATTQNGYAGKPLIEIRGDSGYGDGLVLGGGSSTVKGLIINRFKGTGLTIVKKGNNTIIGNYIGTNNTGSAAAGNNKGIVVQLNNNLIQNNLVSGNKNLGVQFWTNTASYNKVIGNKIGTDATGAFAIGNGTAGVSINGAPYNTIGGLAATERNIISGNAQDGVVINQGGAKYNKVLGNFIGTDITGTKKVGNKWYGVEISRDNNLVQNNLISGNEYSGLVLWLSSSFNNKIIGNKIGTDVTGTKGLGNWWRGIDVSNGASNNTIGGPNASDRNIVSGNGLNGVLVYQGTTNLFQNNYIGTDITGTKDVHNFGDGFRLVQTNSVTIRDSIIGFNTGYGVHNGASTNTKIYSTKLIGGDTLFLVKAAG